MKNAKALLAAAAVLAALSVSAPMAQAKVYSIPAEDAIATVNVPDDWTTNETDRGIELNSSDSGIYVDIEGVKANDVGTAVEDSVKLLASQGLEIDESTKQTSDTEANGLKMHDFLYKGKDKDGPTNFSITLVETAVPDEFLMVTFWGSDAATKANEKTISAIANSVQLTKH